MNKYTIYCTEEQTKKALELGAPIETYKPIIINSKAGGSFTTPTIETVTAEQMIGWLEEQGLLITITALNTPDNPIYNYSINRGEEESWTTFSSRKEATLAVIDTALKFLKENKK